MYDAALKRFLPRLDHQPTPLEPRVFAASLGVVLAFVVADQADFVVPAAGIRQALTVEIVLPDERSGRW